MMRKNILLVDDENLILSAFKRLLRPHPYNLHTAQNIAEATKILKKNQTHLVICDQRLVGEEGLDFLKYVQKTWPHIPRILLTGYPDAALAERALNEANVFRFLTKPWDDNEVLAIIQKGLEKQDLVVQNTSLLDLTHTQQERLSKLNHELEIRTAKIKKSRTIIQKKKTHLALVYSLMTTIAESESLENIINSISEDTKKVIDFDSVSLLTSDYKLLSRHTGTRQLTSKEASFKYFKSLFLKYKPKIIQTPKAGILQCFPKSKKLKSVLLYPLITHVGNKKNCAGFLNLGRLDDKPFDKNDIEALEEISGPLAVAINKITLLNIVQEGTKQWEQTFDAIEDPVTIIDKNFNIVKANIASAKIFAHASIKSLKSKKCYEILAHSRNPCKNCPLKSSLRKKTPSEGHDIAEFKDRDIRTWSFPIVNKKKIEFVVQYYKDLTEEKAVYRRLIQSEKMSAVGLLTSSVAHEINNPITGILGLSQILKKELSPSNTHHEDVLEIESAALRCKEIIENLLSFSKELGRGISSKTSKRTLVNINEVIESTLSLVWFSAEKKSICIEKKFSQNLPQIRGYFSELQQVFFNLFNNAYHAIDNEGTIEIVTRQNKNGIQITISDTGSGIDSNDLPKIFDPFFTTKKRGKGTGLGLSVSHDIIKKYSGTIDVESKIGEGSVFNIMIPTILPKRRGQISKHSKR